MTISPAGWMPTCTRCKVQRHDRCIGPMECGCQAPEHRPTGSEWEGPDGSEQGRQPEGTVHHIDPDDETVIIEMQTRLYAQLREASQLQDRDPGVVLRRALEHYLECERAGCRHQHDERPGGAVEASGEQTDAPPAPLEADPALLHERPRS